MDTTTIRDHLERLARLEGLNAVSWASFDLASLPVDQSRVDGVVKCYFSSCVPSEPLETWIYVFWSPAEIRGMHSEDRLGERLGKAGLVGIGDESGNLITVDVRSGACRILEHQVSYDDQIQGRDEILNHVSEEFDSFVAFLIEVERRFAESVEEDRESDDEFLAAAASDPAATDDEGRTLLHRKIADDDAAGVLAELDRGAPLIKSDPDWENPIDWAILWGASRALRALLDRGAVAEARHIALAAEGMEYDCLDMLVATGLNVAELGSEVLDEICEDSEVAKRLGRN